MEIVDIKINPIIIERNMDLHKIALPKKMVPSKDQWERLGFIFLDVGGSSEFYNAALPFGWSIKSSENLFWFNMFDSKNNLRGKIYFNPTVGEKASNMFLTNKYDVRTEYYDENRSQVVYFGNEEEKLFIPGIASLEEGSEISDRLKFYDEVRKLKRISAAFGRKFYPNYKDELAYWDEKPKKHIIN